MGQGEGLPSARAAELCGERAPPADNVRMGPPATRERGMRKGEMPRAETCCLRKKVTAQNFPQRTVRGSKGSPHFCRIKQGQSPASTPQLPPYNPTQQRAITHPHAVLCQSHVTPALSAGCLPGTHHPSSVFAL